MTALSIQRNIDLAGGFVLLCILGSGHAGSAKYTLGRASEMTHEGWCTVFFAGLHPLEDQSRHTLKLLVFTLSTFALSYTL